MYAYFEFEDELDRDIVHIETHAGFRPIETAKTVEYCRGYHDALVAASLEPDESRALIRGTPDDCGIWWCCGTTRAASS